MTYHINYIYDEKKFVLSFNEEEERDEFYIHLLGQYAGKFFKIGKYNKNPIRVHVKEAVINDIPSFPANSG